jgi:DNA-binding GntR family transcriptional regulator
MIPILLGNLDKFKKEHQEILELVVKGDDLKAGQKMKMHILKSKEIIMGFFVQNRKISRDHI